MEYRVASIFKQNGFGATVIAKLMKMGLKKNLYYEVKDVVVEERQDGIHAYKQKVRTKVYGLTSTKAIRQLLIDILLERVENHKDKIISPIIYNELLGMEIKRNGKIEHSASTHDDQVFSMLMALYMWYEGTNMAERFGLRKTTIKTDDEIDEQIDYYNDDTVEIVEHFNHEDELHAEIEKDLNAAIQAGGIPMQEFLNQRRAQEKAQFEALVQTPMGERAYRQKYNIPDSVPLSNYFNNDNGFSIPESVFFGFYNDNNSGVMSDYNISNVSVMPEDQAFMLEDDGYRYQDHFNF